MTYPNRASLHRHEPSIWAIVPVKPLSAAKTRLAHVLTVDERSSMMAALFQRTLGVLNRVASVDRLLVISGDPAVLAMAREVGAMAIDEGGTVGLNLAVARAAGIAGSSLATSALVLPADLPFVQKSDVEQVLQQATRHIQQDRISKPFMVICPDDKEDGTNALFISLATPFTFRYGPGSFRLHLEEAERRGVKPAIVRTPNLEFDLDTEDDWHRYLLATKGQSATDALHRSYRM